MTAVKMHENEIETDASLVRRLLSAQFPQWAALPIVPVSSAGTDNALYHLGDDLVVRLPRIDWAIGQVEKEHKWMPKLAPFLPLAIPLPLEKGQPGEGYPWEWSIYKWRKGRNATLDQIADPIQAAVDTAEFILALQAIDPTGGPDAIEHKLRGVPLSMRDTNTRDAIAAMNGIIDGEMATAVWETALEVPDWNRSPVWFHGDLLSGNLLFENGHLSAVIDFGGLGVGDPACDLMIAWGLFSGESREIFRSVLAVDDGMWARGRGQALSQAVIFIPYYLNTNPVGVDNARRMIDEVLADYRKNG
jgi:aminoglycoside phosphotransferase (APT) family kinase protein